MSCLKSIFLLTIALFISGCATTALSPERAAKLSDYDVCKGYRSGSTDPASKAALENEVKSRSLTCETASYYVVYPWHEQFVSAGLWV